MNAPNARDRRLLLRSVFACVASAAAAACSGGGDAEERPLGAAPEGKAPASPAPAPGGTPSPSPAPAPGPSPAPAPAPAPTPMPPEAFLWQIASEQTLALLPGTTTTIATGALGMAASVSPALPSGRTLAVTPAGRVVIVAAADAPSVNLSGTWRIDVVSA